MNGTLALCFAVFDGEHTARPISETLIFDVSALVWIQIPAKLSTLMLVLRLFER